MRQLLKKCSLPTAAALLPQVTAAQLAYSSSGGPLEVLLVNILLFINNVLIPFIIGMGFLFFVWGMFRYFILGGADEEKKAQGRSLMVFATLGFVIIIIFFGVINLITSSTGLSGERVNGIPSVPMTL